MNNHWDQEAYISAWRYASQAHLGQCVPATEISYIHHLGLVTMEAIAAIQLSGELINDPNLMIQCALLHDTIEDTSCSYKDIEEEFGRAVADGVMALSKNDQLASKQHKMLDSLNRIQQQSREIWMVKLADRITNLQKPPSHWSQEKAKNYWLEAQLILEKLGSASPYLANRLQGKIDNYKQYLSL